MSDNKIEIKKTSFIQSFKETFHLMPEQNQTIAEELLDELCFMKGILSDLKRQIAITGATDEIKNGNDKVSRNQTPEFKTYLETTNRYNQYLKHLIALYPKEVQEEVDSKLEQFLRVGSM